MIEPTLGEGQIPPLNQMMLEDQESLEQEQEQSKKQDIDDFIKEYEEREKTKKSTKAKLDGLIKILKQRDTKIETEIRQHKKWRAEHCAKIEECRNVLESLESRK